MNEPEYYQKKIMIVDDDPDIVYSLRELFESQGFQVTTAENGRNCLLELEKGFQGIIILDLMMPMMDGVETIKKMTIDGFIDQNIIIVLTAKRIQGDEFNEIYPYINDYITKPFDINILLQTIKKIAQRPPPKRRL
ncbi:MAG: response regulator [Thermoplasmata archaeon]|jgi:DNA-binding response OmpR family regulator|nr:response regulator [Thermoplasmata archaeon]MBE3137564.1 response regulator [Thermoplasmata archaeon]MBE3141303.1 response regulator [Thermoplasmata archaeon]